MLKLKDNVDLKELEKYGFIFKKYMNDKIVCDYHSDYGYLDYMYVFKDKHLCFEI